MPLDNNASCVANVLFETIAKAPDQIRATTKWSHARCAPTKASSATLSFGNAAHINVTTNFQICSKFASSTISGVAPLSIPIS